MPAINQKTLSETDKRIAFIAATHTFSNAKSRWQRRREDGLTDGQLEAALQYELGIAGGRSGSDKCPYIEYQGAELKIWAAWSSINPYETEPIFKGADTVRMAREIYGIKDPSQNQMDLFNL